MKFVLRAVILGLILSFIPSPGASAQDAEKPETVQIRPRILECEATLTLSGMNDGVGLPFATGGLDAVEAAISQAIQEKGRASLIGSTLNVTGIDIAHEDLTQKQYEALLTRYGFAPGEVEVKVFSAPRSALTQQLIPTLQEAWSRLQYFFPSMKRSFQKPLTSEVIMGFLSTIPVEIPNVVYLTHHLNHTDAAIVLSFHTATVLAYTIFTQTLLNWLTLKGSGRIESFLRQCATSLPFVLNFRIFGNASFILSQIQLHGFQYLERQGPHAVAHFLTSDLMTTVLQTVFYSVVINRGAGGWVNEQAGEENIAAARTMKPFAAIPILIPDAMLLAYATASQHVMFHLGAMSINDGHLMFLGLTAIGWAAYRPAVLEFFQLKKPYFVGQMLFQRSKAFFVAHKFNPLKVFKRKSDLNSEQ